jgi:murein DD-endopeptidase MepM/ murein hydrolase activator NlpD
MMRERSWRDRERRKAGGCLLRALLLAVLLVLLVGMFAALWTGPAPAVTLKPGLPGIGRRTPVQVKIDDTGRLTAARLEVIQGSDATLVAERKLEPRSAWAFWQAATPLDVTVDVGRETVQGLRAGTATVRVTAERAGTLLRRPAPVVTEVQLPVRLAPPILGLVSSQHYVAQGGSEVVVYRVGESAVRDGVRSGSWWFPGFPYPGNDKQLRFALFAVPFDTSDASAVRLVAVDDVGNEAAVAFVDQFFPKPVGTDTIELSDEFLQRVVPEILGNSPEIGDRGNLLANYLQINGDLRRKNAKTLQDLAAKSAPRFLWNQAFLPMQNAAITAAFADRRTYVYQGKPVDQQVHLGFDMASVERDAIPSSNQGVVVLARYFGIYGNAVVVDHGYGLMSLYGHLSSIEVKEGQAVERGQTLGRSGKTGLAGGDHLHFTLLLQGLAVRPVEWWDAHWIQDRIARKLGPALQLAPAG